MRLIIVGQPNDQMRLGCHSSITLLRRTMFGLLPMIALLMGLIGHLPTVNAQSDSASAPHLYFFTSDGCAPCEVIKPSIVKLADAGYPTTTINVRQQPQWAQHFRISRTPTVVLVQNERAIGRREGMIRHDELVGWFNTINYRPGSPLAVARPSAPQATGTKVVLAGHESADAPVGEFKSPTMHQGTRTPANAAEERAMAATVKLQVRIRKESPTPPAP